MKAELHLRKLKPSEAVGYTSAIVLTDKTYDVCLIEHGHAYYEEIPEDELLEPRVERELRNEIERLNLENEQLKQGR